MPNITVREYNPESGALLGNISTINFGRIGSGSHTGVKVIDIAFDGVTVVSNVKIGLVSNANITVNSNPQGVGSDGSAENGNFGIETSSSFNSTKASANLSRHFAGLNGTAIASNTNNVLVGERSDTISNYIYLDVRAGSDLSGSGNGSYKIFFDYS